MQQNTIRARARSMKIAALGSLCLASAAAFAVPSQKDVEASLRAGDWPAAESMLKEVVAAKPTNAKAWYLLAETEEKLGNKGDAGSDLRQAEQLDPSLAFASPGAAQALEARLSAQPRATRQRISSGNAQAAPGGSSSASGVGWLVGIVVVIFLFWLAFAIIRGVWRMIFGYPVVQGYGGGPGSTVVVNNGGGSGTGLLGALLVADALRDEHRDRDYGGGGQQGYDAPPPPPSSGFDLGGSDGGWDSGSSSSGSSGSDDW